MNSTTCYPWWIFFLAILYIFLMTACVSPGDELTTPEISSISPTSTVSHLPAFTLRVMGSNFSPNSKIFFNGNVQETQFVSDVEISCQIDPSDNSLIPDRSRPAASDEKTTEKEVPLYVRDLIPEGKSSSTLSFVIRANHNFSNIQNLNVLFSETNIRVDAVECADLGQIYMVLRQGGYNHSPMNLFGTDSSGADWNLIGSIKTGKISDSTLKIDNNAWLHAIYHEYSDNGKEIWYTRSADHGQSWITSQNLSNVPKYQSAGRSDLSIAPSGNLYVIWTAGGASGITFRKSTDHGQSWDQPVTIYPESIAAWSPRITCDPAGRIYIVWAEQSEFENVYMGTTADIDIYFTYSDDSGKNWATPVDLTPDKTFSVTPEIAVDHTGGVFVIWSYSSDVYFRRSLDSGLSWEPEKNLTQSPEFDETPKLAIDTRGNINLVWGEQIKMDNWMVYRYDIVFSRSIDRGQHWSTRIRITDSDDYANEPKIALSPDGYIAISWEEVGNWEYKQYYSNSRLQ